MKKRFVAKKRKSGFFIKMFLWFLVAVMSLVVTFNVLLKTSIMGLLGEADIHDNLLDLGTNQKRFLSLDLLNPTDLFKLSLNYTIDYEPPLVIDELKLLNKHENSEEPVIYLYSSHDTEGYDSTLTEAYNIKYNVKMSSYILSEYLADLGIPTYIEQESMGDYLKANGLNYNYSYYASKYYIEQRLKQYPSIKLMIDMHRDAIPRSASVASLDGKSYAKVLFVVAVDYEGSESNDALAVKLNSLLPKGLSRGISRGNGYKANGYFNQDLFNQSLILEIGGMENTIEEVNNTLKIVAEALHTILNGG